MDYSYLWNVNLFRELMEELKTVHGLAYTPLLKYLIFLRCRPPMLNIIHYYNINIHNKPICISHLYHFFVDVFVLTDRSTLTTRDAKLIFDAYTSFAFDPCFPSIWSNLF